MGNLRKIILFILTFYGVFSRHMLTIKIVSHPKFYVIKYIIDSMRICLCVILIIIKIICVERIY